MHVLIQPQVALAYLFFFLLIQLLKYYFLIRLKIKECDAKSVTQYLDLEDNKERERWMMKNNCCTVESLFQLFV